MGESTKAFIAILLTCSKEAQARGLRLLEEYGINERDLTEQEVEEAAKMLADIVNQDRRRHNPANLKKWEK